MNQPTTQQPHRLLGISVHTADLQEAFFASCEAANINSVELSCTGDNYYMEMDWEAICKMIRSHGVSINSVHLRFNSSINVAHLDPARQAQTLELHQAVMAKAATQGIKTITIHPSAEPISDEDRPTALMNSKKALHILAEYAASLGQVIAVENLPRTCLGRNSDEMKELLSADSRLRVCFDTNHLLGQPIADFVRALGDKIITLHVSDYDFINERHMLPGELDVNWVEFMDLLDEIGYAGVFNYEVTGEAENRYIRREADLTPEDYRKNYDSLSERREPVIPVGTVLYR